MVSNIFYFHSYLGKWSNLTNTFQRGWNHQLEHIGGMLFVCLPQKISCLSSWPARRFFEPKRESLVINSSNHHTLMGDSGMIWNKLTFDKNHQIIWEFIPFKTCQVCQTLMGVLEKGLRTLSSRGGLWERCCPDRDVFFLLKSALWICVKMISYRRIVLICMEWLLHL